MPLDIRCDKCGKLVKTDAAPGGRTACPNCGRRLTVPAHLASLPRPLVAPNVPAAAAVAGTAGGQVEMDASETPAMTALAGAMPWVTSFFLHLGLFLVMLFLVMLVPKETPVVSTPPSVYMSVPDPGKFGGVMDPKVKERTKADDERREMTKYRKRITTVDPGKTDEKVKLLAPGSEGGESAADKLGLRDRNARGGPSFIGVGPGPGAGALNILYVIDRSGSMSGTFDEVRQEMETSISRLKPRHYFDIILFGDNAVYEGPRKGLVPADDAGRLGAGRFLRDQSPHGHTTALVALKRAFEVLRDVPKDRPGKLIYLLSDGDFSGMTGGSRHRTSDGRVLDGNEAVLAWLRDNNRGHEVMINTFLLHSNDRRAIEVMRRIAEDNDGQFKHISADE